MTVDAYAALCERSKEVHLLESTAEILSWDQETMMPPGGGDHRADQVALLAKLAHERATDPRFGEWLAAADDDAEPESERGANVREWRRSYGRRTCLPADLVAESAAVSARGQQAWAEARAQDDFARFRPWLERLVDLARRKAECYGVPDGGELWDALAEDYEPGMRAATLERLFGPLAADLTSLVQELGAVESARAPSDRFHAIELPEDRQEAFVREVSSAMGFDFERGRIDRSAHPFCGGSHFGDVRITTRFRRANVSDALGSTMHETGHGLYEQGLPADHIGTPLGTAVSLGIHESQSRLWENHVGRSREFWSWCRPVLHRHFGSAVADLDVEELFRATNLVRPSLIRVEADEATYNLHVIVRFDLERALVRGDLGVGDLPGAWRDAYRERLGIAVPDDASGCLQDVHWSCGLFGYFPTYTLGSIYAAQFYAAAERDLDGLSASIAAGEFAPLRSWLREHVHRHGSRYDPDRLCALATGSGLDGAVFLDYLRSKLRSVYGL